MKKLLITGATGFLGRNFIQCIEKEKYEIFILGTACPESVDNDHFYICDWTGFDADRINEVLNRIQAEVLVMCAWDVSTQSYWNAFENHMWADVSIQLAQMFLHTGGGISKSCFLEHRQAMIMGRDG